MRLERPQHLTAQPILQPRGTLLVPRSRIWFKIFSCWNHMILMLRDSVSHPCERHDVEKAQTCSEHLNNEFWESAVLDDDGLPLLSETGELVIPVDDWREYDEDAAIFTTAHAQSYQDVRQQLKDRSNARGGYVDKPTGRGKQNTMLTLRTSFKDKVGGRDHRGTAKQLLTRIRCHNCGKLGHDTDRP